MTWLDDEHIQDDQGRHNSGMPMPSEPSGQGDWQDDDNTRLAGQSTIADVPIESDTAAPQPDPSQQHDENALHQDVPQPDVSAPHDGNMLQQQAAGQSPAPQSIQPQPVDSMNPHVLPQQTTQYSSPQQPLYAAQPQPAFPEPAGNMPAGVIPPVPQMPVSPYPQAFQAQPQPAIAPTSFVPQQPPYPTMPPQPFQQPAMPQQQVPVPPQPAPAYPAYQPQPIAQPPVAGYGQPQVPQQPAYPPYLPQVLPPAQFIQTLPEQWQAAWEQKRRIQAAKHDYSMTGWALILMIAIWLVGASAVTVGVLLAFSKSESIPTGLLLLLSNLPLYAVGMPVSLLVFRNAPRLATKQFDMPALTFIKLLIATIPVMVIGSIIGNLIAAPFSKDGSDTLESVLENTDYFSLFVLTCVCAPIFEEWIFRKEIISRTRKYGEKTAIVVSALCFGLFHGNIRQFVYAFGLGLILGYIYVRTSKLWYTMLMHALVNFNGGVVSLWMASRVDTKAFQRALDKGGSDALLRAVEAQLGGVIIYACYALVMLGLFIAGIVILVKERRNFVFFEAPEELPAGMGAKTAFGNSGMIVFIIFGVLMTLGSLLTSNIPADGSFNVGDSGTATMLTTAWQALRLLDTVTV